MNHNQIDYRLPSPWPLVLLLALLLTFGFCTSCNSSNKLVNKSAFNQDISKKESTDSVSNSSEKKSIDSTGKREWESETVIDFKDGGKITIKGLDKILFPLFPDIKGRLDTSSVVLELDGVNKLTHKKTSKDTTSKSINTQTKSATELNKNVQTEEKNSIKEKVSKKETNRVSLFTALFSVVLIIFLIIYINRK